MFTVKFPTVEPAGTVIEVGTVAKVEFDDRYTIAPFGGAAPLKLTDPDTVFPPTIDVGERVTGPRAAGVNVKLAVC